jgi:hypothetical protein
MLSAFVIRDSHDLFFSTYGPVAQRLEQGTHNSRKSFCACFHCIAQRRYARCFDHLVFAPRRGELRRFAAKISQTVENDREKFSGPLHCCAATPSPVIAWADCK